ncbi:MULTISPECIES: 8-oxo-dGTP diphosphatase MutT [unclassified Legionella]|uniref:8-oxo-dGTP diphosphatase MutT n=1 Tax=unclassified Legionella TaxID=2622702 RepID=UPI001055D7E0|nr:8-oxo-dGTP diphosphatase MutT [Legionella sp. W10-070]MDI9818817.1 8-oxo-dGTP diphosphatase MutT [Legionella sp. PL877]
MKVAVGVIFNDAGEVLITRRPLDAPHGGMWEFPGGKLEANELPETALIREIKEEVGIDILDYRFLGDISHSYGMKSVNLLVFSINRYCGDASCQEGQLDLRWVTLDKLSDYEFPEANSKIIALMQGTFA